MSKPEFEQFLKDDFTRRMEEAVKEFDLTGTVENKPRGILKGKIGTDETPLEMLYKMGMVTDPRK